MDNLYNEKKSRRVCGNNVTIKVQILITSDKGHDYELELKGITQGYNLFGLGANLKMPEEFYNRRDAFLELLNNSYITIKFDFPEAKNSSQAIGVILRTGIPKMKEYDIFCAIEFDYLPPELSLIISKKLKVEDNELLNAGQIRENFFEIRKEA